MTPPLVAAIRDRGVSLWLDDLGRERLTSGSLRQLVETGGITGVTTNPSIFAQAVVRAEEAYAQALADAARAGASAETAVFDLMIDDVAEACALLACAYRKAEARDGYVSLEVDPRLAHDTAGTIDQAQALWDRVGQPNVMIKIPATLEGLPAISEVLARGINVNVTLIFSLERYAQVRAAHLAGLRTALERGHRIESIGSVASFFVSRLDTAVDGLIDSSAAASATSAGAAATVRGSAAVMNARAAYADYLAHVTGPDWAEVAARGAIPQRPLWASTGTKDPSYSPMKYVTELVTPGAVNTVPAATFTTVSQWVAPVEDGAGDDEEARPASSEHTAAAAVLSPATDGPFDPRGTLSRIGIDYDAVVSDLEAAGVAAFVDAWNALLDSVATAMQRAEQG
jgi:transaldolase